MLDHLTIDAELAPYSASERDLFMMHLDKINKGDMLLLDRGYPCFWLLFLLKAKGIEFCVRLKDDWWLQVKDFVNATDQERIVEFRLPKKDQEKLSEFPHMQHTLIKCRLIKVVLENGQIEVLCTSLLDTEKYDREEFKRLYHYRRNEEEAYKLLKGRVELEAFSGKTAKAVKQDFYAKIFLMSMCASLRPSDRGKSYSRIQSGSRQKIPAKNQQNKCGSYHDGHGYPHVHQKEICNSAKNI